MVGRNLELQAWQSDQAERLERLVLAGPSQVGGGARRGKGRFGGHRRQIYKQILELCLITEWSGNAKMWREIVSLEAICPDNYRVRCNNILQASVAYSRGQN